MRRRIELFIATLSVLALGIGWALPSLASAAAVPKIYAVPAQFTVGSGGNVSIPVHVNPNGSEIDTVEIKVSFPAEQLTFMNVDKAGSAFDTFVPGAPKASNGSLEFSAAKLGKAVTSDALVGTLVFTAKTANGTGVVDLTGSAAARNGVELAVTLGNATVGFGTDEPAANAVGITNVTVTDVTINSGTIRWKTAVASTSSVDYGSNVHYGFSAGSEEMTTEHVVKLAAVFSGNATVHYAVSSRDTKGNTGSSKDSSFTTLGYTIAIKVTDKEGKILSGASVQVGNGRTVKTDSNGVATATNVPPGNQKVIVDGGKIQFVAVQSLNGANAANVQKFSLKAEPRSALPWALTLVVVLVVAVIIGWLWHERSSRKAQPSK